MGTVGQSTNKLGQLFVDIGIGGAGQAIKSLNSISASFLLVKTAAKEAMKPIVNMINTSKDTALYYGKMNSTLGVSLTTIQQLSTYLEKFNLSDALISDLGSTMDMLNRVNMGLDSVDGSFVTGLQRIGLNWQKYRGGTFEDMLNLVQDVQTALDGMDVGQARVILQMLRLPTELLYGFEKGGFNIRDALLISEDEIKKMESFNEQLNIFNKNKKQLQTRIIGNVAPIGTAVVGTTNKVIESAASAQPQNQSGNKPKLQLIPDEEINQKTIINSNLPPLPTNLKSSTNANVTIAIQNENNIYGGDAQEIADRIAGITNQDIETAENNAFQISNIAGA